MNGDGGARVSVRLPGQLRALLAVVLLTAVLGVSEFGTSRAGAAAGSPGPTRIMIVGDSISQGSSGDYTWRYRLWNHLTASGASFVFVGPKTDLLDPATGLQGSQDYADPNFGTAHDSTWGRTLAQEKETIASEVTGSSPDVLLVMLGIDDLIWIDASPDAAIGSMQTLITNARTANPNVRIVLSTLLPHDPVPTHPDLPTLIDQFNTSLRGLAASAGTTQSPVSIADPATGFDPATDTYDASHPNPSGEFKIAAAFADALAQAGIGGPFGTIPAAPPWPKAPSMLTATPLDGAAALSWSTVPGASGYVIYQRDVTAGQATFTRLPYAVSGTQMTAGLLHNGDTYEWAVSSAKVFDEGPMSTAAQATPAVAQPSPPPAPATGPQVSRLAGVDRYATAVAVSRATFSPGVPQVFVATGVDFPDALAAGPAAGLAPGSPILLVPTDEIPAEVTTELQRLQPKEITVLGGPAVINDKVLAQLNALAALGAKRLYGATRYDTAAKIATAVFPAATTHTAMLAVGSNYPDALSGGPVGGLYGTPILLSESTKVPTATLNAMATLGVHTVMFLGGIGVLPDALKTQIKARFPAMTFARYAGPTRYDTSAVIALGKFDPATTQTVYLAVGSNFPDALAGAPSATAHGAPVLLSLKDCIPTATYQALQTLTVTNIVLLGGTGVLSSTAPTTECKP